VVTGTFGPIRARVLELLDDPAELDRILAVNADRAAAVADETLATAFEGMGFLPRR
jgi:tryptophanyl-tRNA synthetase